jgi:hypothetical protein
MKWQCKNAELGISDFRAAAVLLFVILNLAVFCIRVDSVWHYGSLFFSVGGDAEVVYPVWKAVHYLPVYEWPLAFPFSLALYNYLFYDTYGFILRLAGETGAGIMKWGSLFTPVFAIIGALAQWRLVRDYLQLRGARSAFSLIFALGLWLCTSIVRGWALTIRPDMAAIALVMAALWMVVRQPRFGFAYAGVLFYLAWSFKQSTILVLAGVCLFLLFQRRWRDLSALAAVFAVLVAVTLLVGTPEFRYNILVAPRIVKEFTFMHCFRMAPKFLFANAYWILAPIALMLVAGVRRVDNTVRVLITILVIALAGGLIGLAKVGAYDNYLFEAFVAGSTLLQLAVFTAPGRLVNALLLFACVQPAIHLATAPSVAGQPHPIGMVGIATANQYTEAVVLRERLAAMKTPIFTTSEVFSLPWFSTGNHVPALVIDRNFHDATRDACQNGCVEGMLQRGEIPTVMLLSSGDPYQSSLNPNYEKDFEAPYSGRRWSIYVLRPSHAKP